MAYLGLYKIDHGDVFGKHPICIGIITIAVFSFSKASKTVLKPNKSYSLENI